VILLEMDPKQGRVEYINEISHWTNYSGNLGSLPTLGRKSECNIRNVD
jgi:hypothetical protein